MHGHVVGYVQGDNAKIIIRGRERIVPHLAPPRLRSELIGRAALLTHLKQQLFKHQTVVLIQLPGVGKSALALRLAYDGDVLGQFVDGLLWVGLGRNPDPLSLLGIWATALRVPSSEI